jgi:hypothetical protein
MSRTVLIVVLCLLIAGAVALVFRSPSSTQDTLLQAGQLVLAGYAEDGTRSWSIRAESGSLEGDVGHLQDVNLTFYENERIQMTVRGDQLERDPSGSTLSGAVRIEQEDDVSLDTDTIYWDERNDSLKAGSVAMKTPQVSLSAGAFQHDLGSGTTTLTRGIEAQVSRGDDVYDVTSDSAETTGGRIVLQGNVSVESSDGDAYQCQTLESNTSGSTLAFTDEVSGTWNGNGFSAGSVQIDEDGIRIQGNVIIDLELLKMDGSHDA